MLHHLLGFGVHDRDLSCRTRSAVDEQTGQVAPRPERRFASRPATTPRSRRRRPGQGAAVQPLVPVRGQHDPLDDLPVRVSRTVVARPEVTATDRPSGLTAAEAPKNASWTVSPTSTWPTTVPVRGSMKVAATPSVPGPRYGPSWPARSSGRVGATTSGPGSTTAGSIGHPAVRETGMRRPEAAVGPDVPHDQLVVPGRRHQMLARRVDLGHEDVAVMALQELALRPAAGGRVDVPQHHLGTLPDGGRPGPVRCQGDVPDGAPVSSEFLHHRACPVEERDHAVVPEHGDDRRTTPRRTAPGASRAGGRHRHLAPGGEVHEGCARGVLLTPYDDGGSILGEVRAEPALLMSGESRRRRCGARRPTGRSGAAARTRLPLQPLVRRGDEHVHQAAVRV